jgi:arylsulfatase A-like enzyme
VSDKPNILIINPDQMRADALHHLGNEASYTPNIDELGFDGV